MLIRLIENVPVQPISDLIIRPPRLIVPGPSVSDITITAHATAGSTTDGASVQTASKTPTANYLQLLGVLSHNGSNLTGPPTVTGCNLTWVEIETIASTTPVRRLTVFGAMGAAPAEGALTIDFDGDSQTSFCWGWGEFGGVDTSGSNGSGAIVQFKANAAASGTTITNTLDAALSHAKNLHVSFCGASTLPVADADFTTRGSVSVSSNANCLEWETALGQQACTNTFPTGLSMIIGVEIKAAGQ